MKSTTAFLCLLAAVVLCAGVVGVALRFYYRRAPALPVGVVLTYEIVPAPGSQGRPADVDAVVAVLERRVTPQGTPLAQVSSDAGQVRIGVYGHDPRNVQRVEGLVSAVGTLEFRILANRHDHKKLIEKAEAKKDAQLRDSKGGLLAWWVPAEKGCEQDFQNDAEIATRTIRRKGRKVLEVLVVKDPYDVDAEFVESGRLGFDLRGRPCAELIFNTNGAKLFGRLTGSNLPDETTDFTRRLGIILDGRLHSAPHIQSTIMDQVEINGNFTQQQAQDLAAVLGAGPLPARLKLVGKSETPAEP